MDKLLQRSNGKIDIELLQNNFGNVKLAEAFIPSFDCRWNFASSSHK